MDTKEEGEASSRRRPQSLNQRNSELLRRIAYVRAQRHSCSENPLLRSDNPPFGSSESIKQEKKPAKVKIQGRRRLCKQVSDEDEGSTGESSFGAKEIRYGHKESNFTKKEGCEAVASDIETDEEESSEETDENESLDEISSRLESITINPVRNLQSSASKIANTKPRLLETFNFLKDIESSKSDTVDEDFASNACDDADDFKEESTVDVQSTDAQEFESALSALSTDKVDDEEEDFVQSKLSALKIDDDSEKRRQGTHISVNKRRTDTDYKKSSTSKVCSTISVSSSVDEYDGASLSGDEKSSFSAESVKSLPKRQTLTLSQSSHITEEIALDEGVEESADLMLREDGKTYKLPGKVAKYLYPHQIDCIKWLWSLHCKYKGGILGDDMGLGKTMQASAFLAGLFASRLIKCALIVAPKTVLPNWMKELSIVGLARKTRDYTGSPGTSRDYALQYILQTGGVLLTTYDVVRNNVKALSGDYHGRDGFGDTSDCITTWDYIMLDEGHIIKNPSTQRAKSLREIPSAHRIILSGTPIQNNLKEMWALFDFCCPGLLGDHREFKAKYENLILQANDKKATQRQKWIGSKAAEELRERIQPYFLRRLKSEVFPDSGNLSTRKLAQKIDIIVWLKLTNYQRKLYEAFLRSETVKSSVEGSALAALTVLKKICDHPNLLTERATEDIVEGMESLMTETSNATADKKREEIAAAEKMAASLASMNDLKVGDKTESMISCKIAFVMALLENLIGEDHRVLIFAQTRKMLNIIQEEIKLKGYKFYRIDGMTKACDREKLVNDFQTNDNIPIFLLTSQVGGLGITLTGADRVIIVDPAWNPSTDNQSVDRAYRIGQLRNVLVYRLMTCGTIEEKIYRKQVFKGGLFRTATEHGQQTRYFSRQELHELFSIPDSGFDVSVTQQQLHEEHDKQHEVEPSVKQHIEFLGDLGIAGVNHHNLLYSKTETVQPPPAEAYDTSHWHARKHFGIFPLHQNFKATNDAVLNVSSNALKPKEFSTYKHVETDTSDDFKAQAIKENIKRLAGLLEDEVTISKLPDKGQNIQRRIKDLTNQLTVVQRPASGTNVKRPISVDADDEPNVITISSQNFQNSRNPRFNRSAGVIDVDNISSSLDKLNVRDFSD